jgi:hypothetical protein
MQQSERPGTPMPKDLSYIDTDRLSNEHNPETDEIITRFRNRINQWKKENLYDDDKDITDEISDTAITRRRENAEKFRQDILTRLLNPNSSHETDYTEEIDSLMEVLGHRDEWSPILIPQLTSLLFTDLFEHPFNFNTTLIDQLKKDNVPAF